MFDLLKWWPEKLVARDEEAKERTLKIEEKLLITKFIIDFVDHVVFNKKYLFGLHATRCLKIQKISNSVNTIHTQHGFLSD